MDYMIFLKALLAIGTFFFMEFVAWWTHKYVMHGFLWSWHKSHHTMHDHALEKNDLFAVVFSVPAILTILIGNIYEPLSLLFYVGIGITGYGIFYFVFHDVIVHRRIKIKFKARNRYLKRMIKAHYIHHEIHEKNGAEAFGFLWAPKKYEAIEKKKV